MTLQKGALADTRRTAIHTATNHLWLIKARLMHLEDLLPRLAVEKWTPHLMIAMDHGYLDVRKIIEELMLLSVCAHEFSSNAINNTLRKEYHAEKIVKRLEAINPRFYPEPIKLIPTEHPDVAAQFVDIEEDFLSKDDAIYYYNLCGGILHSSNKKTTESALADRASRLQTFLSKASNLFRVFEIEISGEAMIILGQLLLSERGRPPELFYATQRDLSGDGSGTL